MKNQKLTRIALRYRALYLDMNRKDIDMSSEATVPVLAFAARLKENGYTLSEELVRALSVAKTDVLISITETINDVMGCSLNWAPLVKGWDVPTGESYIDHLITLFVNVCNLKEEVEGITLPCGHFIPEGTFPIERYNGCPFCGTPFETENFVYKGQGTKLDSPFSAVIYISPPKLFIFNTLGSCIVKRYCSQKLLKLQSYSSRVASYVV